jgi:type I restriction enzyme S subunit
MVLTEIMQKWVHCKFGDIVWLQNGYAFPSKDYKKSGVPLIRQSNLAGDKVSLEKCVFLDQSYLESRNEYILKRNDILIGMSGSIGKICIYDLEEQSLQNQRTGKIVPFSKSNISWKFLWFYLQTIVNELKEKGKGLGVSNVSGKDILSLPFSLPPLNEQNRIVAKLEKLLAKVDQCKARLGKIPKILKSIRESVFAAAFSGELTADWRSNQNLDFAKAILENIKIYRINNAGSKREFNQIIKYYDERGKNFSLKDNIALPNNWLSCQIGDIGNVCNGSTPSRKMNRYWNGNIPWVSSGEVQNNIIDVAREKITELGYQNSSVRILPKGTVLIAMIGEGRTRGQSSILNIPATINQNIAAINIEHKQIDPEYLWYWFQRQYVSNRRVGSGSGPQALNCQRVRELPFILPPLKEQKQVVRNIKRIFERLFNIEARYIKAVGYTDDLTQSILSKAFHGELVPQDHNDEPASELLKSIKEKKERATASQNKIHRQRYVKRRKKPVEKSDTKAEVYTTLTNHQQSKTRPVKRKRERIPKKPPAEVESGHLRLSLSEIDKSTVMAAFRSAIKTRSGITADELLKHVSLELGYLRLTSKIRVALQGHMLAAKIRKIIHAEDGLVYQYTKSLEDYDGDFIINTFKSVMQKRKLYDQDEVIKNILSHLGFRRASKQMQSTISNALRFAVRKGLLSRQQGQLTRY